MTHEEFMVKLRLLPRLSFYLYSDIFTAVGVLGVTGHILYIHGANKSDGRYVIPPFSIDNKSLEFIRTDNTTLVLEHVLQCLAGD